MAKEKSIEFLENSFLSPILGEEDVTDISYNGEALYFMSNRYGRKKADIEVDKETVGDFLRQIANMEDRKWSYSEPILDLSFGKYRLNAVFSSLVRVENEKSYSFSLRIESRKSRVEGDKYFFGGKSKDILLKAIAEEESVVIGGKTGTGKTELQKWMLSKLPPHSKTIVIDNVEELSLIENCQTDMTTWLASQDEESYARLVKNALRSNPDYVILAEARGSEAFEALQSAMSGHPVIMTIHARGTAEMPSRIANMAIKSHEGLDTKDLLRDIKGHFRYYVYLERKTVNGVIKRRIAKISRLNKTKMETLYSCERQ